MKVAGEDSVEVLVVAVVADPVERAVVSITVGSVDAVWFLSMRFCRG